MVLAAERPGAWSAVFNRHRPVATEIGGLHTHEARPGDHPEGPVTSAIPAPGDLAFWLFDSAAVQPGRTALRAARLLPRR